tara:strand:- start:7140 stop:7502 length:363 start_codon:yes stop_codon:yes gene_type:complete
VALTPAPRHPPPTNQAANLDSTPGSKVLIATLRRLQLLANTVAVGHLIRAKEVMAKVKVNTEARSNTTLDMDRRLALADTAVRAMVLPHPAAMVSKLDMVVLRRDITADLATTTTTSTIR